jgi:Protein of unknown function (DUF1232)
MIPIVLRIHQFFKIASTVQTASALPTILKNTGYALAVCMVLMLWFSGSPLLRGAAFLSTNYALYRVGLLALSNPNQFFMALCASLLKCVFTALRFGAKGLILLSAAVYAISPIDLISDVLIGLGWIEDILFCVGAVVIARSETAFPNLCGAPDTPYEKAVVFGSATLVTLLISFML